MTDSTQVYIKVVDQVRIRINLLAFCPICQKHLKNTFIGEQRNRISPRNTIADLEKIIAICIACLLTGKKEDYGGRFWVYIKRPLQNIGLLPTWFVYCQDARSWVRYKIVNTFSANPTKWPNTLKQLVENLPTNCLSVFEHFVKLAFKGLIQGCHLNCMQRTNTVLEKKLNMVFYKVLHLLQHFSTMIFVTCFNVIKDDDIARCAEVLMIIQLIC